MSLMDTVPRCRDNAKNQRVKTNSQLNFSSGPQSSLMQSCFYFVLLLCTVYTMWKPSCRHDCSHNRLPAAGHYSPTRWAASGAGQVNAHFIKTCNCFLVAFLAVNKDSGFESLLFPLSGHTVPELAWQETPLEDPSPQSVGNSHKHTHTHAHARTHAAAVITKNKHHENCLVTFL